jgi:hypothetical protein
VLVWSYFRLVTKTERRHTYLISDKILFPEIRAPQNQGSNDFCPLFSDENESRPVKLICFISRAYLVGEDSSWRTESVILLCITKYTIFLFQRLVLALFGRHCGSEAVAGVLKFCCAGNAHQKTCNMELD